MYKNFIKAILDKIFAITLLITISPLILIICIVQFIIYKNDIFFVQYRVGIDEKEFKIIKFRTMLEKFNKQGDLLPDRFRLTKFGKILRLLSLDEIPNLINVLKGDMSFIGPRPLPISYLRLLTIEQRNRFKVKPGITGLAQIMGRNRLTLKEKIIFDLNYIHNYSFLLDLKILAKTFSHLFDGGLNEELGDQSFNKFKPNLD